MPREPTGRVVCVLVCFGFLNDQQRSKVELEQDVLFLSTYQGTGPAAAAPRPVLLYHRSIE